MMEGIGSAWDMKEGRQSRESCVGSTKEKKI
jgi:hypothetical protein